MAVHSFRYFICYCDTDAGGVVYHASYLRIMECARMDWLSQMDLLPSNVMNNYGIIVIFKLDIKFIKPLYLEDNVEVVSECVSIQENRVQISQNFKKNGEITTVANIWMALVKDGKSTRFPDNMVGKFTKYQNGKSNS